MDTLENPLPIVVPINIPGIWAVEVYTDISGHILDSPSVGIYIPAQTIGKPLAASIAFPRKFLTGEDSLGKSVSCKTTALEALGILTALCLDPFRFAGREVRFWNDNVSTVIAYGKGYSRDPWTTCLVRAARVVAAGIGASLFVSWEARRSSHGSVIADNLTHNILEGLSTQEVQDFLNLSTVSFPDPILEWMGSPGPDRSLGANIVIWIFEQFPALKLLFAS